MIDTHIHIIPGVDDGAVDLEISKQMLRFSIAEGVTEMIATPHFKPPRYDNQEVFNQYKHLTEMIRLAELPIKVHLGNEIHLSQESMSGLALGQAKTMGDSHYLLIELPSYHFYPFHEAMLSELLEAGYKIVLAHIERYPIFQNKPEKLGDFVKKGIYGQLSSMYIIERRSRKKAFSWLETGLIHIIASDGHNLNRRPPLLKKAYDLVSDHFSQETANILFKENPYAIIKDQELKAVKAKRNKRFSFI